MREIKMTKGLRRLQLLTGIACSFIVIALGIIWVLPNSMSSAGQNLLLGILCIIIGLVCPIMALAIKRQDKPQSKA